MQVNIDEDQALDMLMERVGDWTDDYDTQCLFEAMYEGYIDGGCFDGGDFNVMAIVDNDFVNWCSVIEEGDEAYEDIKELHDKMGCTDISCEEENHGYSYIEAEHNGKFLVRN